MVIYRGPDGKPGYHQTDDIHDAVGFVEQLRNDQGVEHARIFRLEEVGFEYRPYFRVELTGAPSLDAGSQNAAVTAGSSTSDDTAKSDEAAKVVDTMVESSSSSSSSNAASDAKKAADDGAAKVAAAADDAAAKTDVDAPTITSSGSGDNGVGARRGLFGR